MQLQTGAPMINTKTVTGRREVRYESYEDFLTDAEQMAADGCQTLGNWSYGQILIHIARAFDTMIDGAPFKFPGPVQWFMRTFAKNRFLKNPLRPGFKLPKSAGHLLPQETSVEEGLAAVRAAIARLETTTERAPHGGFGTIPKEEHDQFAVRHAEMHMTFVVPRDAP